MYQKPRRNRMVLITLTAIEFFAVTPFIAVAAEDRTKDWRLIKAELSKRQARFHCVTVEFEQEFIHDVNRPQARKMQNTKWKVQLKGDLLKRLETKGDAEPRINTAGKRVAYQERISVTDGLVDTSFYPNFGGEYDAGFVDAESRIRFNSNVTLTPLAICFRPLEWLDKSDRPPLSADDVQVSYDQRGSAEDVVVAWSNRGFDITARFDPTRRYAPLELSIVRSSQQRKLFWRIDYEEGSDSDIPTGWKFSSFTDGGSTIIHETSVRLLSYRADDILDSAFMIEFPVGTFVMDQVLKQNYILLKDGSERVVKDEDWHGKSYDDILNGR